MGSKSSAFAALNHPTPTSRDDTPDLELNDSADPREEEITNGLSEESDTLNQFQIQEFLETSALEPLDTSNFTVTEENVVFGETYVRFSLKEEEYLLLGGQYELSVQKGAVIVNGISMNSGSNPVNVVAPMFKALPVIKSVHSDDASSVLSQSFQSVILVRDYSTGLQNVGELLPPLRNIFSFVSSDSKKSLSPYEAKFYGHTFTPILPPQKSRTSGTLISDQWKLAMNTVTKGSRILVIGTKNSGKSTFVTNLINQLLQSTTVNVMDIDPGQPEFSSQDCISLSEVDSPIFGMNMHQCKLLVEHYTGFSSPSRQPTRYISAMKALTNYYWCHLHKKNLPLLINTPGWIKGFGIELLKDMCSFIKPTQVIFLTYPDSDEENELMNSLRTELFLKITGVHNYNTAKSLPSHLRSLRILQYFHQISPLPRYNFTPLLHKAPYRVSFSDNALIDGVAISFVTILDAYELHHDDIPGALDGCVVAVYSVPATKVEDLFSSGNVSITKGLPNYVSDSVFSTAFDDLYDLEGCHFFGHALIHSVDLVRKVFNVYMPKNSTPARSSDQTLILIRGRTEIPIGEIAPKLICDQTDVARRNGKIIAAPYVTFHKRMGKGSKELRFRRNILRNSHGAK
ncbi:Polynucleotide kinase [Komagataella phaffii CBS 7435]|uniref:Polynucleotide 5'-hydroxyl-kinase GRC3 n=2 Tax=Komagataella phaffii TaxID=460519 RepID=C4R7U5_KOMPG|nr:uncharacterized protein PAS_chr4_0421 [Komagataella phaffii GS115]AOA65268.1 GQ67_04773T0 [Komagataella phaffii]CAH2450945.1 Polynucleotide kinase [Komagataella phaffii CBS 7435]AOA69526.1 GQ68_04745T0 [Komagataella phaffii GS115]CAY71670.1 Protein of unknown function, required for cell growth and possibly involved in rRNA processing [Komagataella phaffii GS115]CCA40726.1 Polynucleotide kinase [Komagataella phaffii CBS 7435]